MCLTGTNRAQLHVPMRVEECVVIRLGYFKEYDVGMHRAR